MRRVGAHCQIGKVFQPETSRALSLVNKESYGENFRNPCSFAYACREAAHHSAHAQSAKQKEKLNKNAEQADKNLFTI